MPFAIEIQRGRRGICRAPRCPPAKPAPCQKRQGATRLSHRRRPHLYKKRKGGPAVIFQEVVHSIGSREADCDEQSSFRGQTEWTSTRMPDLPFAVERRWLKPSFMAWVSAVPQPAFT